MGLYTTVCYATVQSRQMTKSPLIATCSRYYYSTFVPSGGETANSLLSKLTGCSFDRNQTQAALALLSEDGQVQRRDWGKGVHWCERQLVPRNKRWSKRPCFLAKHTFPNGAACFSKAESRKNETVSRQCGIPGRSVGEAAGTCWCGRRATKPDPRPSQGQ